MRDAQFRRSPVVTTTHATRLAQSDGSSHATSNRLTAASMNRRGSSACSRSGCEGLSKRITRLVAAAAPPRQAPTRLSVAVLDGQRLVDRPVDAIVRRRDRDDRCSSNAIQLRATSDRCRLPQCLAKQLRRLDGRRVAAFVRTCTSRRGVTPFCLCRLATGPERSDCPCFRDSSLRAETA